MTPPHTTAIAPVQLPSDDEIQAFYRSWFEANFCTPPAATANRAVIQAIRAALEHFGPTLRQSS